MISRRRFIGAAGGAAGAAALGGGAWATLVRSSVDESVAPASASSPATTAAPSTTLGKDRFDGSRVLVVVEMAGGNDALNTLVPSDGRYRDARPQLAIAEDQLVALGGADSGLHPALAPLASMWDRGTMAAVAGVGMTDQSRSHFKAMDAWWSAVPGGASPTGWLGRWLDATTEGEPDPLRAIALGGGGRALVGLRSQSTIVQSPRAFQLRTFPGVDRDRIVDAFLATAEPLAATPELAAAQAAIPSTIEAIDLLAQVSGGEGDTDRGLAGDPAQPEGNSATELLQTAAGIIDLGIGTRVITVGMSGFDTHADQADRHHQLLADMGEGIVGFFERIEADGHGDQVMLVTTTEFGRRVEENGSAGTDHGNGGLQFLFGPTVQGGATFGELDLVNLDRGDLPTIVDTRSVYSVALDWLGGPSDEILDGRHDRLGLVA